MQMVNKVAAVTGGGTGIGQAIALCFAAEGVKVVVAEIQAQSAEQTGMYYRGVGVEQDAKQLTCYAESRDGIHWTRPSLDIHEFEGFSANNIVWVDKGSHNFAPFKDSNPDAPSDQCYKALAGGPLRALVSADGLYWKLLKEDVISDGPSILRIWASGSRFARSTSPSTGISSDLPGGAEDPFYRNSRHQDRHLTKLCRLDRRSVVGLSGCSPEALCFML